jgi:CRISPR-associated protein (TIGR02710 family)
LKGIFIVKTNKKYHKPIQGDFMKKVLIVSVGGTCQPILTAVRTLRPDRVIFFCSGGKQSSTVQVIGEGKPCFMGKGDDGRPVLEANLVTQLGLGDKFDKDRDIIIGEDPDNLSECSNAVESAIAEILRENPEAQVSIDYTGGTKTMSSALLLASINNNLPVYLTTSSSRENLIKVERGERTRKAPVFDIYFGNITRNIIPGLLKRYNYSASVDDLQTFLVNHEFSGEKQDEINRLIDLCSAFDEWDRFNHIEALAYLKSYTKENEMKDFVLFLKRIITSRSIVDENYPVNEGMPGYGYEVIEDLLLNAERRAHQKRYDDAVGRIYRAIELTAQIRLKKEFNIRTGDIDIAKVPEHLQEFCLRKKDQSKGKIQLALRDSFELLADLEDPFGLNYREHRNRITDALVCRNNSLFAHGFSPISESDYSRVNRIISEFINANLALVKTGKNIQPARQFPDRF